MWPFSRPAVLIPLAWWAMYLVNRWRVGRPVLGLIDAAAEKAGFYPVPAKQPRPTQSAIPREPNPARSEPPAVVLDDNVAAPSAG